MGQRTLDDLQIGEKGIITKIIKNGDVKRKMLDMSLLPGTEISVNSVAPLGDPVYISVRGYIVSLLKSEAKTILIK